MPKVIRRRTIAAPREEAWALLTDPHSLPRWWPRVKRVEDVEGGEWTAVLATAGGRDVRARHRRLAGAEGERCGWDQLLEGTPFARHLRRSRVAVELRPGEAGGTEVSLRFEQATRGLSRLGAPLLRGAQGRILEEALDGIERALGGAG